MDKHGEVHPEASKQIHHEQQQPKATKIPKPTSDKKKLNVYLRPKEGQRHHRHESSSAPTSPRRHQPYSLSPLPSPAKSGESTPTQNTQSNFNSTKSMPTMPSRIPVPKPRYNVPRMESASMTESLMSSEFSSTVDLEGTPSHSSFPDIEDISHGQSIMVPSNNNQTCTSPSMLYPSSSLAGKLSEQEHNVEQDSSSNSALPSFSTITVPSGSDKDDEISHSISHSSDAATISSKSLIKASQLLDLNDSTSKTKMSAEDSAIFDQPKPDTDNNDKVMGLMKELEDAHTCIQFLEDENRLLKEKTSNELIHQSVGEEHKQQMMEVTQRNEELTKKLSILEEDHLQSSQQIEKVSTLKIEMEDQMSSMRMDLTTSQNKATQLEQKIAIFKNENQKLEESLAKEKNQSSNLQRSVDKLSRYYSVMTKNVDVINEQNTDLRRTINKNDEDIRCLNEDVKLYTKEKESTLEEMQLLTAQKESLSKELELTKEELLQARAQHKNSELKLREVGQKLSAVECEAKDKAATIDSEVKKNEMVTKENEELQRRIQKLENQLNAKERELTSLSLKKQGIEEKAIQQDNQFKKNEQSRTQEIIALTKEMEEIKAKNKQMHEQLLKKEKVWKDSERYLTKLRCSLESEEEQKNTVTLKLTSAEEELTSLKSRYKKLEHHGQQFVEDTETKIAALKEVEDSLQQQLKMKTDALKLKEDESHTLAINLRQAETEIEKAKAKTIELETQVALSVTDVENHKKLCEKFQSKLQLIEDSKHQEIAELNTQLNSKRSEIAKLNSKLESIHIETENLKVALQESNKALEHEKNALSSVQSDLKAAESNGSELASHLNHLEEQIKSLGTLNTTLNTKLEEYEMKNIHQSDQIDTLNQSLNATLAKSKEGECEIKKLKISHFKEVHHLCKVKDKLENDLQSIAQYTAQTQEKFINLRLSYEQISLELQKEQDAKNSLQLSLGTETESRNELAKRYTLLETQCNDTCSRLKTNIMAAEKEIKHTKDQLADSQNHCATVEKEIELLRQKLIKTQEEMEEKLTRLVSQHEKEITDSKISYKNLQDKADKLSEEIAYRNNETAQLKSKLEKGYNLNQQLKKKVTDYKANETSRIETISELEIQLANEMESKMAIKRDFTLQLSKEHDLQLKLDEIRNKLSSTIANQESVEVQLNEEKRKVATLQDHLQNTKGELKKKQDALTKEKEMTTNLKLSSEAELSQLKKKYHSEIKVFKDKCKDLNTELNLLKASCVNKASAIDKLQALSEDLERGNRMLQSQLDKVKKEWEEKSDMLKTSQARNQGLEIQLAKLQSEVSSLTKSQLEFEEYKKKIESSSREELQRVLKEVTHHMEEQHTAHHYLETLRKENESIALKEKDRQIDQLKNHLKRKKQELKKDKLHIETLEIESRFLKSLQKDNSKSRHEIEERLGKISDALSVATASSSFSSGTVPAAISQPTSTPIKNKSFQ